MLRSLKVIVDPKDNPKYKDLESKTKDEALTIEKGKNKYIITTDSVSVVGGKDTTKINVFI